VVGKRRENSISQSEGLQKHYAKLLVTPVRGFCVYCGKPLLNMDTAKVSYHLPCRHDSLRRFEPENELRTPGRPEDVKICQKRWAWATLWDLGERPSDISKLFDDVSIDAIKDGIVSLAKQLISSKLGSNEDLKRYLVLYRPEFHERVSRFWALAAKLSQNSNLPH
jgi:hypothetical protein